MNEIDKDFHVEIEQIVKKYEEIYPDLDLADLYAIESKLKLINNTHLPIKLRNKLFQHLPYCIVNIIIEMK